MSVERRLGRSLLPQRGREAELAEFFRGSHLCALGSFAPLRLSQAAGT